MNRTTTASTHPLAPCGPVSVSQTSLCNEGGAFALNYAGTVPAPSSVVPGIPSLAPPSSLVRLATTVLIPVLAATGWVCLYYWWQFGGVMLLAACPALEVIALVLLLSLLRQSANDFSDDYEDGPIAQVPSEANASGTPQ